MQVEAVVVRIAHALIGRYDVGDPELGGLRGADGIRDVGRHDADHLVAAALQRNGPAERRGIRAEPAPPQPVAQDHHVVATLDLVIGGEGAPHRRAHAQDVEELRGDFLPPEILRFGSGLAQCHVPRGKGRHRLEDLLLRGPVHVVLRRDGSELLRVAGGRWRGPGCAALAHGHEPVVLIERQAAKHHGVNHGEDRRAGADAQHQHDQCHGGERLRGPQRAEGGFQIIAHGPLNVNPRDRV
jgi:hypothetical protein